jgi:hypothetical protein
MKPAQIWRIWAGTTSGVASRTRSTTPKPVIDAGGEAMVKACGVAMDRLSGEKLGTDPVNGYIVNVGCDTRSHGLSGLADWR